MSYMNTTWEKVCDSLQKRLSPGTFKVWIAPLVASEHDGQLFLYAPSLFVMNWIQERLFVDITEAVSEVSGGTMKVQIEVKSSVPDKPQVSLTNYNNKQHIPYNGFPNTKVSISRSHISSQTEQLPLPVSLVKAPFSSRSWRYSFDSFVVGPCNNLAHAAAQNMIKDTASVDTLFLSSGPGLGKTHLTQAVGQALCNISNRANPKVEYLTAEEFCSCFVQSLRTKNVDSFKGRFRDTDLFLLEDIHFLQGKEKMQDELLATIRSLQGRGSRVVLTSSFAPKELKNVDNRLVSRFCSGFLAGIEKPNAETRRRILIEKAKVHAVVLSEAVADFLAMKLVGDIRQLESSISNLVLKAKLLDCMISMDMAKDVIAQYTQDDPFMNIDSIIHAVSGSFGLQAEKLYSRSRKQDFVVARNTIFYLARKHTDMSLQEIGDRFHRRHSTVLKGIASIEREIQRKSPTGRQIANTLNLLERTNIHLN